MKKAVTKISITLILISIVILPGCVLNEDDNADVYDGKTDQTVVDLQVQDEDKQQDENTVNVGNIVEIIEEGTADYEFYWEEKGEWLIGQCEPVKELASFSGQSSTISISKSFENRKYEYTEAKDFLHTMIDYDILKHYLKPDNDFGITELFRGSKDDESYYLIYCDEDGYLVRVQGTLYLEYELLSWGGWNELTDQYERTEVECANNRKNQIISDISYQQNTMTYELFFDQQEEADYTAVIQIDEENKISCLFTLYQDQKEVQKLEWGGA